MLMSERHCRETEENAREMERERESSERAGTSQTTRSKAVAGLTSLDHTAHLFHHDTINFGTISQKK